jgi:hypothetical protein
MTPSHAAAEFDYLSVDDFLKTFVDARALKSALELSLIDYLHAQGSATLAGLTSLTGCDRLGLQTLLVLLRANRVVEERGEAVRLSEPFLQALRYRDLLEAKLDFANLAAADFFAHFTSLLVDPGRFVREAHLFRLFDYGRCFDPSPENREWTRRWMRFTTALTRYEAQVCLKYYDFGSHRRLLDIGGNSGEFVLRVCKKHPAIRATVLDLPTVCAIGEEHVRHEPEADRITFLKGNALYDPIPAGFDLIVFKSFLHDWPEAQVRWFLARANQSLAPGGTILIFERGPLEIGETPLMYSLVPMLLFFRSFRSPRIYQVELQAAGYAVGVQHVTLDMPFQLVTAQRLRPEHVS